MEQKKILIVDDEEDAMQFARDCDPGYQQH